MLHIIQSQVNVAVEHLVLNAKQLCTESMSKYNNIFLFTIIYITYLE